MCYYCSRETQIRAIDMNGGLTMNSNYPITYIVPFEYNEDKLEVLFVDWISSFKDSPIDAASSEIVSIEKIYYPVRCYFYHFDVSWNATSIWEGKEQSLETVYETETVFVSKEGTEYKQASHTEDRVPLTKVVPKTIKSSKIVQKDKKETSGTINNCNYFTLCPASENSELDRLLSQFTADDLKNADKYSDETLNNIRVTEITGDDEKIYEKANKLWSFYTKRLCAAQVPGTRHENLKYEYKAANVIKYISLLPVYEIVYKYDEVEYTVYFNGKHTDSFVAFNMRPQNEKYNTTIQKKSDSIITQSKTVAKNSALAFFAVPLFLFGLVFVPIAWRTGHELLSIIALAVVGFITYSIYKKVKTSIMEAKKQNEEIDTITTDNQQRKEAINNIVLNASLSDDEKKKLIDNVMKR